MFDATCSNCGKPCRVPFRPTNGKPVLCSDCFRNQAGGEARNSYRKENRRGNNDRGNFGGGRPAETVSYKEQFEALNNKLDRILKLLVQSPSAGSLSSPIQDKQEPTQIFEVKEENVVREEDMQLVPSEEAPIAKKKRVVKKKTPVVEVVEIENAPSDTDPDPSVVS
jgi:CxxC-x17-CxxC domain-containing protein